MLGNLGNITNLLKAAKDMQGKLAETQKALASRRFDGDAGGGMVRVTVDGRGTLLGIKIEPQAVGDERGFPKGKTDQPPQCVRRLGTLFRHFTV